MILPDQLPGGGNPDPEKAIPFPILARSGLEESLEEPGIDGVGMGADPLLKSPRSIILQLRSGTSEKPFGQLLQPVVLFLPGTLEDRFDMGHQDRLPKRVSGCFLGAG